MHSHKPTLFLYAIGFAFSLLFILDCGSNVPVVPPIEKSTDVEKSSTVEGGVSLENAQSETSSEPATEPAAESAPETTPADGGQESGSEATPEQTTSEATAETKAEVTPEATSEMIPEAMPEGSGCVDDDKDGFCKDDPDPAKIDCDDKNKEIFPGATEVCDGKDNNCNGKTDENFKEKGDPCQTGKKGACGRGVKICTSGKIQCLEVYKPVPETCDGVDNDCNGQTDEKFSEKGKPCTTKTPGVCRNGITICSSGSLECLQIQKPTTETCNGKDDDCDGQTDEPPCKCKDGAVQSCYSGPQGTAGVGICKNGKQTCTKNKWGPCIGAILPGTEVCDGKDNNCNGKTDENFAGANDPCKTGRPGVCSIGLKICQKGKILCEDKTKPSKEVCDGKDNDCDGTTDEDSVCGVCKDGTTQSCYSGASGTAGVGLCKKGTQTCSKGQWGNCVGEVNPATELCDGKDNDCDGQTDETFSGKGSVCNTGKKGICAQGIKICTGGKVECLQLQKATTETCNSKDDDCDGQTDEGSVCGVCKNGDTRSCYSGTSGTQGVGECKGGTQTCVSGQWGNCTGEVLPNAEVCNGKDDDCDGTVDEGVKNTYYQDSDNDGYGNSTVSIQACQAPAGYVNRAGDCYDKNKDAYPGQNRYFDSDRGDGSFDYNCNGLSDKEFSTSGQCTVRCTLRRGFTSDPGCGKTGSFLDKCDKKGRACSPITRSRTLRCR